VRVGFALAHADYFGMLQQMLEHDLGGDANVTSSTSCSSVHLSILQFFNKLGICQTNLEFTQSAAFCALQGGARQGQVLGGGAGLVQEC